MRSRSMWFSLEFGCYSSLQVLFECRNRLCVRFWFRPLLLETYHFKLCTFDEIKPGRFSVQSKKSVSFLCQIVQLECLREFFRWSIGFGAVVLFFLRLCVPCLVFCCCFHSLRLLNSCEFFWFFCCNRNKSRNALIYLWYVLNQEQITKKKNNQVSQSNQANPWISWIEFCLL